MFLSIGIFWGLPFLQSMRVFSKYHGRQIYKKAYNFTLLNPNQEPVSLNSFKGKYVFLFFGYTSCGLICPITMEEIHKLSKLTEIKEIKFLFISLDPLRDNPESLKAYISRYGNNFIALFSFDIKIIQKIQTKYMAYSDYSFFYSKQKTDYEINHTGFIYLIDSKGFLRLVYTEENPKAEQMFQDLQMLIQNGE